MTSESESNAPEDGAGRRRFPKKAVAPAVIIGALLIALALVATSPKAKREKPPRNSLLVEVVLAKFSNEQITIEAMGSVEPAVLVELRPRVAGEVIEIGSDFLPGGLFDEGETALVIDPTDYRLAVRQSAAALAQAELNFRLEEGNQSVALQEFAAIGEEIPEEDRDLVLRGPQRDAAAAALDSARAGLERARLNLRRTTVRAPFNAIVRTRNVNIGSLVSESASVGGMVGTDQYWIVAPLPVDQLKWIAIPTNESEQGSIARVYDEAAWGAGRFREGRVLRVSADLEEQGRMAKLLVAVDDPFSLEPENEGMPRLLLGSYVKIEIDGLTLDSTAAVERAQVRDGNKIWLMNPQGELEIREVEIAYRGREKVFIASGLNAGERIVASFLSAPVAGMMLRTEDESPADGAAGAPTHTPARD